MTATSFKPLPGEPETVLVTGASGDIGDGISTHLSEAGYSVVRIDRVERQGRSDVFMLVNLENSHEVEGLFERIVVPASGKIHLVNAVGLIHSEPLAKFTGSGLQLHSLENWSAVWGSNVNTVFNLVREFTGFVFRHRLSGSIINFSSVSARGTAGQVAYSAAKSAIEGLSSALGKELAPHGIRVMCIAPGYFETKATVASLSDNEIRRVTAKNPLRKLGNPSDLSRVVQTMLEAEFLNATTIRVDGGFSP